MWDFMYRRPPVEDLAPPTTSAEQAAPTPQSTAPQAPSAVSSGAAPPVPGTTTTAPVTPDTAAPKDDSPRLAINSPRMSGSVRLRGARFDELLLSDYRDTIDPESEPIIVLLSPARVPPNRTTPNSAGTWAPKVGWRCRPDSEHAMAPRAADVLTPDEFHNARPGTTDRDCCFHSDNFRIGSELSCSRSPNGWIKSRRGSRWFSTPGV